MTRAHDLDWLKLHLEWGADEAIEDDPTDRLAVASPPRSLVSVEEPRRSSPPVEAPARNGERRSGPGRSSAEAARTLAEGADGLPALEEAIRGFTLCALRDTAGALVFADGPADAPVALVIDAPSAEDDASGIPLSGALGLFFDGVLASAGFDRKRLRVATLVPWRPPGDRPANPSENACCLPFLQAHLRLLRPRVVLVAGGAATRALTGAAGSPRALLGTTRPLAIEGLHPPADALFLPAPSQLRTETRDRRTCFDVLLSLRVRLEDQHPAFFTSP